MNRTKSMDIPSEDKLVFIKYYKCTFAGVVLDWLDTGASYDIFDFCKKVCDSLKGSGKSAFLKYATK